MIRYDSFENDDTRAKHDDGCAGIEYESDKGSRPGIEQECL